MSASTHLAAEPTGRSAMDISFRRGGAADYDEIRRLWEAVYGVPRSAESIRWLYETNPAGACQLWLAQDHNSGRIVACRPVFPWRMRAADRDFLAAQAGNAMTHPDFRRLGLFGALVKRAWSELQDQGIPFSFSFSEAGSLSVYKKTTVGDGPLAGTHEVLHFQRMVYPLSLRPILQRTPAMGKLIDTFDRAQRALHRLRLGLSEGLTVFPVHRFGEEFDQLWARTSHQYGVLTVRDSRYLNWRFIDLPSGSFQVLGLRSRGELVGYIVFELDEQDNGWIADLFGLSDPRILIALLKSSLAVMQEHGCLKASLWAATESPFFAMIRRFGFLPREQPFPMSVHVYRSALEAEAALDGQRWWVWYGDRDVERLAAHPRRSAETT